MCQNILKIPVYLKNKNIRDCQKFPTYKMFRITTKYLTRIVHFSIEKGKSLYLT